MIQKLEVSGIHTEVNSDLLKYVEKKIGKLDQYMPKSARESAHAEVKLKERKIKQRVECSCEVVLHLPHEVISVKEATINMYAAIDVVEEKLKNQIKKYKHNHGSGQLKQRIVAKLKRTEPASAE